MITWEVGHTEDMNPDRAGYWMSDTGNQTQDDGCICATSPDMIRIIQI